MKNISSLNVRNSLTDFASDYAEIIVGIDIQGQSDFISIRKNEEHLDNRVGENEQETCILMRLWLETQWMDRMKRSTVVVDSFQVQ